MLLFKKKFLPAIRAGTKTQTIRVWQHRRMRSGQRSYIPGAGSIEVLSVEPVELAALGDDDAAPDGFATVEDLRRELSALYDEQMQAGYRAYRVVFRLAPKSEEAG